MLNGMDMEWTSHAKMAGTTPKKKRRKEVKQQRRSQEARLMSFKAGKIQSCWPSSVVVVVGTCTHPEGTTS